MILGDKIYLHKNSKVTKTRSSQEKIVFGLALARFLHRNTITEICLYRSQCRLKCIDLQLDVVMHMCNTSAGESGAEGPWGLLVR